MFSIEQNFGSVICPFVRKNEKCGRSHCVFSHKNENLLIANNSSFLQRSSPFAQLNSEINELEYDPVNNYSVAGLTPESELVENLRACKEPTMGRTTDHSEEKLTSVKQCEEKASKIQKNTVQKSAQAQKEVDKLSGAASVENFKKKQIKAERKRKVLTDLDFLSIKSGGCDADDQGDSQPKKKKVKKIAHKERANTEEIHKSSTGLKGHSAKVDTSPSKVDYSPSKNADVMKKRLELLSQLKATLGTPNNRLPVLINASKKPVSPKPVAVTSETLKEDGVLGMSATKVRVAHQSKESIASDRRPSLVIPNTTSPEEIKKPMIQPVPNGHLAKIPTVMRQLYLDKFFEEYRKLTTTANAFKKSAKDEKSIYDKVNSKSVYMSSCVNALKRLAQSGDQTLKSPKSSPRENDSTPLVNKFSESFKVYSPNEIPNVSGESFYKLCEKFCLTEAELELHGYPGYGASNKSCSSQLNRDDLTEEDTEERVCHRCGTSYTVYAFSGLPITGSNFTFHEQK